jgi:hypothetical protein
VVVWEGFWQLCCQRQVIFGAPQPISLADILAWFEMRGITDTESRVEFLMYLLAMDEVWRFDAADRRPKKDKHANATDDN